MNAVADQILCGPVVRISNSNGREYPEEAFY